MPSGSKLSPIISTLSDWVKGLKVSDECICKMQQFGFIFPDRTGQLQLTPHGKQTLREMELPNDGLK